MRAWRHRGQGRGRTLQATNGAPSGQGGGDAGWAGRRGGRAGRDPEQEGQSRPARKVASRRRKGAAAPEAGEEAKEGVRMGGSTNWLGLSKSGSARGRVEEQGGWESVAGSGKECGGTGPRAACWQEGGAEPPECWPRSAPRGIVTGPGVPVLGLIFYFLTSQLAQFLLCPVKQGYFLSMLS